MEFIQTPQSNRRGREPMQLRTASEYKHRLQFYLDPPTGIISLQQFEQMAIERMKVLKVVEAVSLRNIRKGSDEFKCREFSKPDETERQAARWDHISHFLLLLANCRSESLRNWLLQQELAFFRFRYMLERAEGRRLFLQLNNMNYEQLTDAEKTEMMPGLRSVKFGRVTQETIRSATYFKVPYPEAYDLIKQRRVFLRVGWAMVHEEDFCAIVVNTFRQHLSRSLALTARALPELEEDQRLLSFLHNLHRHYLSDQDIRKFNAAEGQVVPEMIDSLSQQSFPLCMQSLHTALRQEHRLKHYGRMQYGLFLKGIGLNLDDALRFWRSEFTKAPGIDVEKFEKQYAYTIRHNYGKEGKRVSYSSYSCAKIITSNPPGVGDHHGCPFRHWDARGVAQRLTSLGISSKGVDDVMNYVKGGHYQMACGKLFALTHHIETDDVTGIQHPNQFYADSRKLLQSSSNAASQSSQSQTS